MSKIKKFISNITGVNQEHDGDQLKWLRALLQEDEDELQAEFFDFEGLHETQEGAAYRTENDKTLGKIYLFSQKLRLNGRNESSYITDSLPIAMGAHNAWIHRIELPAGESLRNEPVRHMAFEYEPDRNALRLRMEPPLNRYEADTLNGGLRMSHQEYHAGRAPDVSIDLNIPVTSIVIRYNNVSVKFELDSITRIL